MKNISLGAKLIIFFMAVGIIPFAISNLISLPKASNALDKQAFNQLEGMREVKKSQIEQFFAERKGDMGILVETVGTLRLEAFDNLNGIQKIKMQQIEDYFHNASLQMSVFARSRDVKILWDKLVQYHKDTGVKADGAYDVTTSEYNDIWKNDGKALLQFQKESGYYDIFIICAKHGHVMYSAAKERDLGTNLRYGPYKDSGLAELRTKLVRNGREAMVDFRPYAPSNNEPASFAGYPIRNDVGKLLGLIAFQLPLDQINAIMQQRDGMGKTMETYLVGSDKLMRSDSYLDPTNHSVKASFANPTKGSVDTEAVREALAGRKGAKVIVDYNNNPVLSVYDPIKILDLTWVVLAEIDVAEAFSPVDKNGNEFYAKYVEMYDYYDLFLFNPDGYAFYTAAKEADYRTNFVSGKYASSGLGKLVRQVLSTKQYGMADFAPYAPSNNDPCGFIAQPVVHEGKVEIVVALQLSLDAINSVMQQRAGMGKSGETYLVGSDKLMRSDSFLDPTGHSVKASFANPTLGSVDTEAAREAISGKTDNKIITDYNGNPVLSAFTPVKVGDTVWALIAEIDESEAFEAVFSLRWIVGVICVVSIIAILLSAFFIARSISNPINRISGSLNEGSDQVASASGQVSSSSQQLAEGASEQAASIEETSSSLEEMSSMTKQNADNASQADNLMKEANQVVVKANDSMKELTTSMEDISKASEETSKIIKTIDEIAFQTNLLALNAAVEAARAGEAGAGFAVVADEVRNLAMRAADAAKNTADLIEGTVKKVTEGSELVTRTNDAFSQVADSSKKVGELVGEISAASGEQADGIEQVNKAVVEMDKVVQQNAANAEESASASEEMSAQAQQMRASVGDLMALVGGSGKANVAGSGVSMTRSASHRPSHPTPAGNVGNRQVAVHKTKEVNPDQVIPMDDDDFKDF